MPMEKPHPFVPKAFVSDPIASTLRSASIEFARRAVKLSNASSWDKLSEFTSQHKIENRRIIEQTIGAIIVGVAGVEGMVNEILAGSADGFSQRDSMRNVDKKAYARWARLWNEGAFNRGVNALEKCQLALAAADLPPLHSDRKPMEDMKALIALRNELVHSEPKFRPHGSDLPQRERDSLERKLTGKFKLNELVPKHEPFIWQRCLGTGCAKWSVETVSAFENEFFSALGIAIHSEILWEDTERDVSSH
mgnify:FL=1